MTAVSPEVVSEIAADDVPGATLIAAPVVNVPVVLTPMVQLGAAA